MPDRTKIRIAKASCAKRSEPLKNLDARGRPVTPLSSVEQPRGAAAQAFSAGQASARRAEFRPSAVHLYPLALHSHWSTGRDAVRRRAVERWRSESAPRMDRPAPG